MILTIDDHPQEPRPHRAPASSSEDGRSNRQSNVAFEHRCLQLRTLSTLPQCSGVQYPIPDWPTVRSLAARNGARNANELGAHLIGRQSDLRITMSSKIYELEVRSQIRVRQRPCALEVEALGIFKARADAVLHQHVVRPVGLRAVRPIGEEQGADWQILG